MTSLQTTELACTSAPDQVLHLFFQEGQNILEARSPDGGVVWATQDTIISTDGDYSGSSMTCYYVDKDANFDNQPSVCLVPLCLYSSADTNSRFIFSTLTRTSNWWRKWSECRKIIQSGRTSRCRTKSRKAQCNIRDWPVELLIKILAGIQMVRSGPTFQRELHSTVLGFRNSLNSIKVPRMARWVWLKFDALQRAHGILRPFSLKNGASSSQGPP